MSMKFSEDVVPLTDLKVNPGRVVKHAAEAHRNGSNTSGTVLPVSSGYAGLTPPTGVPVVFERFHRPVLLTSRGRGVAVMQSVSDYEQAAEECAFMRAVVAGLADLDAGREVSLSEAKARFGLA
jgi:hypothetical protein